MAAMSNNRPATALPWHLGARQAERIIYDKTGWAVANATVYHGRAEDPECRQNARYIVHAANAYARLVDAVKMLTATVELHTGNGAREQPANWPRDANGDISYEAIATGARALLRELGEGSTPTAKPDRAP